MSERKPGILWTQLISYSVFVALSIVCVLLIVQNRDLKHRLSSTTSIGGVEALKPGERVESFKVKTLDGNTVVVNVTDPTKRHLLFLFSTTCPHCERTLPIWNSIAGVKLENCDVLGISLHGLAETIQFLESKKVRFYTASIVDDLSFENNYKVGGVPETILINKDGIVEKSWIGELNEDQAEEINESLIAKAAIIN